MIVARSRVQVSNENPDEIGDVFGVLHLYVVSRENSVVPLPIHCGATARSNA